MYAVREVARRPGEVSEFVADFSAMRLALAVVLSGVTMLAMWLAGSDSGQFWIAGGFALYLVARSVQPDWLLRGLERYFELAVVNVVMSVLLLLATYALIRGPGDARFSSMPWFLSYLLGTLGMFLALRFGLKVVDLRAISIRPRRWATHWRESVHFTLSNGVSTLQQNIPIVYVHWLGTATKTGLFAAPFRLVVAMVFVSSVVPMVVYPILTDLHSRGRTGALRTLVAFLWIGLAVGAGGIAVLSFTYADSAVRLLFGPGYESSADVLRWLSVFFVLRSVRAVFVRTVSAGGNQRANSFVSIASVGMLLALLGIFSAAGVEPALAASIALTACEACVVVAMGFLSARTIALSSSWQQGRDGRA
jgi:O-antigen/teichoic acid export membrane protein